MKTKRIILYLALVWLGIVVATAVHGLAVAFPGGLRSSVWSSVPAAADDTRTFFVIQRTMTSNTEADDRPLWTRRSFDLSQTSPDGSSEDDRLTAEAIEAPLTIRFRHARGGIERIRVQWLGIAQWDDSGRQIIFQKGAGDFIRTPVSHFDRAWDREAVLAFIWERAFFCIIMLAPIIAIACLVIVLRTIHPWNAGTCERCGYDLRGNPDTGCPECGWKRNEEGAEGQRDEGTGGRSDFAPEGRCGV